MADKRKHRQMTSADQARYSESLYGRGAVEARPVVEPRTTNRRSSSARVMDERALAFLKTHTDRLMVLDALEYGMADVDEGVRAYLEPALFYAMNVELRAARGKRFDHSPEIRRYMGIEKY